MIGLESVQTHFVFLCVCVQLNVGALSFVCVASKCTLYKNALQRLCVMCDTFEHTKSAFLYETIEMRKCFVDLSVISRCIHTSVVQETL